MKNKPLLPFGFAGQYHRAWYELIHYNLNVFINKKCAMRSDGQSMFNVLDREQTLP